MSKDYELTWPAHPNFYNNNSQRDFKFYFSEPENGVNEDTGIILFIPGFGGNANSNVYKKMRREFADSYNLVTVQCDYFGQEFMQGSQNISINISKEEVKNIFNEDEMSKVFGNGFQFEEFLRVGQNYNINVTVQEKLEENIHNFNDMGILQALDNITAITYVIQILKDNKLKFNANKIILFGQSHGAYLSYLCNALAPNLFSLLIDNSSWLFPQYLKNSRYLYNQIGRMTLQTEFSYYAKGLSMDEELLFLPELYKRFDNHCNIQCFHGTTDNLISHPEKYSFCKSIDNCHYNEIGPNEVDGVIFKSTTHGLDADFLELFKMVLNRVEFINDRKLNLSLVEINTRKNIYKIDYQTGIPVFKSSEK